jgi:hypothetical protein
MRFSLPSPAIAAASRYFNSFSKRTRTKGEDDVRNKRVTEIEPADEGHFVATVESDEDEFEADLFFENGEWSGVCDCDVGDDCQHCYAALRILIDHTTPQEPAAAAELVAQIDAASLEGMATRKLSRKLAERELEIVRAIQKLFEDQTAGKRLTESTLTPLVGRAKAGLALREYAAWPAKPKDVWEAWLYLAHVLSKHSLPMPEFLVNITAPTDVDDLVAATAPKPAPEIEDAIARTKAGAPKPPPLIQLRAVFGPKDVRLEYREDEDPEWTVVKRSRYDKMSDQHDDGALRLADDESDLVWAAFSKGVLQNCTLSYTARECSAAVNELLRTPEMHTHVVNSKGEPFRRVPQVLEWKLEAPQTAKANYKLRLVLPDGSEPPPPLAAIDGAPALYVAENAIYEAPPLAGLSADPATPNVFPRTLIESGEGVALLDKAGVPIPDSLNGRVERHRAKLVIDGWLEDSPREEYLMLRFRSEWDGATTNETYTLQGWALPGERPSLNRPAAPAPAAAASSNGKIIHMDRTAMNAAPSLVAGLGASWNGMDQAWVKPLDWNFPEEFSAWLATLPESAELKLDPALTSLGEAPIEAGVRLDVEESGMDWFDVRAVLDVPDLDLTPDELRVLLEAGGGWVRMGDEGWRRLELKWSKADEEQLADLGLSTGDLSGEPQRLHTLQLASDKATKLMREESAVAVRRRAEELRSRVNPELPTVITASLRPYQVEGFHFLAYLASNHFGGILADDMGLGKTLQTLTWLAWLRELPGFSGAPSLVVCPKSVTSNWRSEAAKFVPGLRVQIWTGGDAEHLKKVHSECDLLVMNYAQLRLQSKTLVTGNWHAVILDEAQAIKNPDSQTTKAACALRAVHRLAVTGTPVENRLLDLWSILSFAMPGMLGTKTRFSRDYDKPTDPLARRRLSARVRPFLLRRTKNQVARDLPPRTEEDLLCELEGKQETLYRAELKRAQQMLLRIKTNKELDRQRFNVLTSLLRLRQICCHPALVDKKSPNSESAKLEALMEMLEPLMEEGHKVLVFSQFVGALDIIQAAIEERQWKFFVLTGETENRGELVDEFQQTEGAATFLLSLKAGGAGLNLTAASYVVLFDPWWNPAVENQAIDRTHRIGQKQQVIAYRLLIRGSIEEKIRALQRDKSALADEVLGEEAFARGLTLDDLSFLLSDESPQQAPSRR